jgi:hypothetical protein
MASLNKNWITEKVIDFEYKKYWLLAYLSEVNQHFENNLLYPDLSELIEHYKNVITLKETKDNLSNNLQKQVVSFDWERLKIIYEKITQDDKIMEELESIINYSIPQFEKYLSEGKKIYNSIEEQMYISPIGVMPLNPDEGYLLLRDGKTLDAEAYKYQITIFGQPDDRYRVIHTSYINTYMVTLTNTYESIKSELIRSDKNIPNPAVFAVETDITFPMQETFLPIAKRALVRYVSKSTKN